jgi:hypothetical protein
MSQGKLRVRSVRRAIATIALSVMVGPTPAYSAIVQSSPKEHFVSVARKLERSPLDPNAKSDREWALGWLTDAPDVSVTVCADPLGGLVGSSYEYGPEILIQYMFAMAVRLIERPEASTDPKAVQLAGVEGALTAYQAILAHKPEARSSDLDRIVAAQSRGELPAFVGNAFETCLKKDAERQAN